MAFSFGLGGSAEKKKTAQTTAVDKTVTAVGEETQQVSSTTQQVQKQQQTEKAVQDILQQTSQEQQQTTQQTGVTDVTGKTTGTQEQKDITSLLGAEPQAALEEVVLNLLEGLGTQETGVSSIIQLLTERATGAGDALNAENEAIITGARASGERELQALQTQLAQQAGGSLANTGVLAGTAESRVDLETQLAGLRAQLNLQARTTETDELGQLLQAAGAEESQIVPLLNILKGAQAEQVATTTTAQDQTQRQVQDVQTTAQILADTIAQTLGTTETDVISNLLSEATSEQQSQLNKLLEEITKGTETTRGKTSASKASFEFGI